MRGDTNFKDSDSSCHLFIFYSVLVTLYVVHLALKYSEPFFSLDLVKIKAQLFGLCIFSSFTNFLCL